MVVVLVLLGSQALRAALRGVRGRRARAARHPGPVDLDVVDEALTEERRARGQRARSPTSTSTTRRRRIRLHADCSRPCSTSGREALANIPAGAGDEPGAAVAQALGAAVPAPALDCLVRRGFDAALERGTDGGR